MNSAIRVFLRDDNGEKFFGEGPCRLLRGIEDTGSLRAAAQQMNMAYTKALRLVRHAEEVLGYPLTEKTIGGKGGGGSRLTPKAKEFIKKYEAFRDACYQADAAIYRQMFSDMAHDDAVPPADSLLPTLGCVLMASGTGSRFGGNKLLADLDGQPMIWRILSATDTNLFAKRIVVTRHKEIANICKELHIDTVLHDLPDRSDTVRLGLEALETSVPEADGCIFCPCDQPLLTKETLEKMALDFAGQYCRQPDSIYRLSYKGIPGSPVLFPKKYFSELKKLPAGRGGAYVAQAHADKVRLVEAASSWELRDVDTKEDLLALKKTLYQ